MNITDTHKKVDNIQNKYTSKLREYIERKKGKSELLHKLQKEVIEKIFKEIELNGQDLSKAYDILNRSGIEDRFNIDNQISRYDMLRNCNLLDEELRVFYIDEDNLGIEKGLEGIKKRLDYLHDSQFCEYSHEISKLIRTRKLTESRYENFMKVPTKKEKIINNKLIRSIIKRDMNLK
jgi:hypothetical protein